MRISTKDTYGIGTVFVVDLWHAPYGVSILVDYFYRVKIDCCYIYAVVLGLACRVS